MEKLKAILRDELYMELWMYIGMVVITLIGAFAIHWILGLALTMIAAIWSVDLFREYKEIK